MLASVELQQHEETLILPARNISLGGVFLGADGHDLGEFSTGDEVDVVVFDALDERRRPVRLRAQVMRLDEEGLAMMWVSTDSEAAMQLAELLRTLQPKAVRK
jgi:PilZ domain-containing protein